MLKGLLENSLDAGATRIDIELLNGGIKRACAYWPTMDAAFVRRVDACVGAPRHLLRSPCRDLARVVTLGFRGEALASLASISRLTVLTWRGPCRTDRSGRCLGQCAGTSGVG